MNISYDKDIDYMEIFFKKEANYADELTNFVTVFKSEKTNKVIGYAFDNASKTVFDSDLPLTTKLAAMLKIVRTKKNLTQDQVAKKIGDITLRHYQRLEAGEDTTLEVLEKITQVFPEQDFSKMLKRKKTA